MESCDNSCRASLSDMLQSNAVVGAKPAPCFLPVKFLGIVGAA